MAPPAFSWLHDRQPVILANKEEVYAWLDTSSQRWNETLDKLVNPTTLPLEW